MPIPTKPGWALFLLVVAFAGTAGFAGGACLIDFLMGLILGIERVAVIGAGALGRRLAMLSCVAGYKTTLEDVLPGNLRVAREEIAAELHPALKFATTVAEAVRDADLVLDSLPDELESKLEIFSMVDRMAPPHTILLTPTVLHSIADLASCTYRAERCFAFALPEGNPGGTVRVVETPGGSAEARAEVVDFWTRTGFVAEVVVDPAQMPLPTVR